LTRIRIFVRSENPMAGEYIKFEIPTKCRPVIHLAAAFLGFSWFAIMGPGHREPGMPRTLQTGSSSPSSQNSAVAAIKETKRSLLGAFLSKDEDTDSDFITDINSLHQVGVLQAEDDREERLATVLSPHRRIKISELVKAGGAKIEEIKQQCRVIADSPEDQIRDRLLQQQQVRVVYHLRFCEVSPFL